MSPRLTLRTAARILHQLRHDRRTIALIIVVPSVLLTLLRYLFDSTPLLFDRVGLIMLPIAKADILFGYGLAFAVAATVQAVIVSVLAYWLLGLDTLGEQWLVVLLAVSNAVLGVALGLFFSAFANSEFQAVQFMPAVILPQVLLCGLFVPRELMADWMQTLSNVMPMTYAVEGLLEVGTHVEPTAEMWTDFAIIVGCVVVALAAGAATLRRRTA
jgi:ABC-2 type transport system permease protein